jgi:hypothetical protein
MPDTFRLLLAGQPASAEFYTQMTLLEVEENMDLPGAFQIQLPVARTAEGDLSFVNDAGLQPFANIAVVAAAEGQPEECIFDGFVLSHKLHLEKGSTNSTLAVWGQDASWLMNLEEKTREWPNVSDAMAANNIFGEYGFTPAPQNLDADSPLHAEDSHTLMQRGTDIQFLRMLARRNGKFVRVVCAASSGTRFGYFARPALEGPVAVTIVLNDPDKWNATTLDIEWDATRPTAVQARQALFTDAAPEGVAGDTETSELLLLDERGLRDFTGRDIRALLTTPVDDAGELAHRARAMLADAGWFARCEGETDLARLKKVLRAGTVVLVEGIGSVHSGKYFVWSVRHSITSDGHRMRFVLVRNAVGPAPEGGALGGLL